MKLRISGTAAECAAAVAALTVGFEVREVSGFYPNRGESLLGRVYVDAVPAGPAGGRVRVTATPTEPGQTGPGQIWRGGRGLPGGGS